MDKSTTRIKTSITLKSGLWLKFQNYALNKNEIARSANIELEKAMEEYMKSHPLEKRREK